MDQLVWFDEASGDSEVATEVRAVLSACRPHLDDDGYVRCDIPTLADTASMSAEQAESLLSQATKTPYLTKNSNYYKATLSGE